MSSAATDAGPEDMEADTDFLPPGTKLKVQLASYLRSCYLPSLCAVQPHDCTVE